MGTSTHDVLTDIIRRASTTSIKAAVRRDRLVFLMFCMGLNARFLDDGEEARYDIGIPLLRALFRVAPGRGCDQLRRIKPDANRMVQGAIAGPAHRVAG